VWVEAATFCRGGKVDEEGLDLRSAHIARVTFVVEEDVAASPIQRGSFCAEGVVPGADDVAHLVEEFFGQ
jgi:hypothetical protein